MNNKSVKFSYFINYIKLLCVVSSIFFFVACDPLKPATESLYKVHFDLNGVEGATPETQIIYEGEFAERPNIDVDDRGIHGQFAAIEWYQNQDGSGPAFQFESTPIAASFWLYAKWTNNFRTVTFEPNYIGAKSFFRHVGTGKTVKQPADAVQPDFIFDGWRRADSSSFDFANTAINDDITLYANWIQAEYTVQFDLNGAAGTAPQAQTIAYQNSAMEPADLPIREGFTFIGWLSDKVDTVLFDFANTPIISDTTLYAGWQSAYAFAFKGREYPATVDGNTFLLNVGKTYTQINDQKVTLLRVPVGVATKPAAGSEIQLSKSWGSFEADESGKKLDYKVKVFVEPTTKAELQAIVSSAITTEGSNVNLNFVETRRITDMSKTFYEKRSFNGDISKWDTSKVMNMSEMFTYATVFNGDISRWNTSKVADMSYMFTFANSFTQDISTKSNGDGTKSWDTSNVTNMTSMFAGAFVFNGNIGNWDTSKVTDMSHTFSNALAFSGDIPKWDTSKVTNMSYMFYQTDAFNGDISKWDTSKVTNMYAMFTRANAFSGDISKWDTSKVTNMSAMFSGAAIFNGDISKWNTSNVTNMSRMFLRNKVFNGDISKWNTSKVRSMENMFGETAVFNGDISKWNTSEVIDMYEMFSEAAAFNRNISKWNTSNVTNMHGMFYNAVKFNQNISGWNVSKVIYWNAFFGDKSELRKHPNNIPPKLRVFNAKVP